MKETILENIIKLLPEKTKEKIVRYLQNEHPLIWEQAKEKTIQELGSIRGGEKE